MRFLRDNCQPNVDIFKVQQFSQFWMVLDSQLRASGIGTTQRKAEPITIEEKEILWQK